MIILPSLLVHVLPDRKARWVPAGSAITPHGISAGSRTLETFRISVLARLGGVYFAFPTSLVFASQILITGLFAMSLDLILGFAGIVTLGHAAFFGIGAYTAGLLATHGGTSPYGSVAAGLLAGIAGYLTSFFLLRGSDLTRL